MAVYPCIRFPIITGTWKQDLCCETEVFGFKRVSVSRRQINEDIMEGKINIRIKDMRNRTAIRQRSRAKNLRFFKLDTIGILYPTWLNYKKGLFTKRA